MTITEVQDQIIDEFSIFDDWMDKYQYLIDMSKQMPPIASQFKTPQYLIKGCQSNVWLNADLIDGRVQYSADSDALITKGIATLLIKALNNQTPADILKTELYFIDRIGLKENLSPTRSNGLVAMLKQMKVYALAFSQR